MIMSTMRSTHVLDAGKTRALPQFAATFQEQTHMTFVVSGVSGHTGSVVAHGLLDQGQPVRVIVRDAAKARAFQERGAEVALADLTDEAALARALDGARGAYLLIPPNMGVPDFRAYQSQVTDSIVGALEKSPVPHVVFLSSVGAHQVGGTGPIARIHDAEKALSALKKTRTTFIRAAYFMENLGASLATLDQGFIGSFTPKNFEQDMVATVDIGRLATRALLEGPGRQSILELSGPEKYSSASVATVLSRIVGKPISVAEAPVEAMAGALEGFGFTPDLAALYQEMTSGLLNGRVAFEGGHESVRGATGVEAVLRGLLGK